MAGRSFWYRVKTGEEIPVHPSEDLCLPLFDKPTLFGLHEEMLDEARSLQPDVQDHALVSLAVKNGWALADAGHNRECCNVIAPSEDAARITIRQLQFHSGPNFIRVEIVNGGFEENRTAVEIHGWNIHYFATGTPLSAFQQTD